MDSSSFNSLLNPPIGFVSSVPILPFGCHGLLVFQLTLKPSNWSCFISSNKPFLACIKQFLFTSLLFPNWSSINFLLFPIFIPHHHILSQSIPLFITSRTIRTGHDDVLFVRFDLQIFYCSISRRIPWIPSKHMDLVVPSWCCVWIRPLRLTIDYY